MSSILSPINRTRFRLELEGYGDGVTGSHFTFPPFTKDVHEIIIIACHLVTDANAGNRRIALDYGRGLWGMHCSPCYLVQNANTTRWYSFSRGAAPTYLPDSYFATVPVPDDLLILPGDNLKIRLYNGQAGDKIAAVQVYWKIYPTGKP